MINNLFAKANDTVELSHAWETQNQCHDPVFSFGDMQTATWTVAVFNVYKSDDGVSRMHEIAQWSEHYGIPWEGFTPL